MDILQQYFFEDDNTPSLKLKPKTVYGDVDQLEKKKRKVHFEKEDISSEFLKCGSQVKILMTKEEAQRWRCS